MIAAIIIIAFSLSIDALAIGFSYGVRNIKVHLLSLFIIAAVAFCFMFIAMKSGAVILTVLPETVSKFIGIILLFFLGVWIIYTGVFRKTQYHKKKEKENKTLLNILIKSFGITIKIIRTPEYCDLNNSSVIEPSEALYLGTVLSIDSIGVGAGISILGISSILMPVMVCIFQVSCLVIGLNIGKKFPLLKNHSNFSSVFSGSIMILIALIRIFI